MFIVLENENIITDIVKCISLEITFRLEKPSIAFVSNEQGEGRMGGINANYFIIDECQFVVGDVVTNEQLLILKENDRKDEFIKGGE